MTDATLSGGDYIGYVNPKGESDVILIWNRGHKDAAPEMVVIAGLLSGTHTMISEPTGYVFWENQEKAIAAVVAGLREQAEWLEAKKGATGARAKTEEMIPRILRNTKNFLDGLFSHGQSQ